MNIQMNCNTNITQNVSGAELKKSEMAGHAITGVGQNLIFGLWSSYMLVFYTDVFGITAGAASIIMMLTRIWDGVNDPLMGVIADRTRTRWGRYRPWLLFMAFPIIIFLVLNFSTPNLPYTGKIIYASITYVLMSMAFTAVDVPYWTLPAAMSCDVQKRTSIISLSRMFTTITSVALGVLAIPLIQTLGKGNMAKGYVRTAFTIGLIGAAFYLIGFCLIREHIPLASAKKIGFKQSVHIITKNEPLLLILICCLLNNMGLMLRQNLVIYYVRYCIGNLNLVPIFSLLSIPGLMLGIAMTPVLTKKYGQKTLYIVSSLLGVLVNVIFFFCGYERLALVMIFYTLSSIPTGIAVVVSSSMIANTIEYAEWKFGQRQEGLITSTQTLITKIGMALGAGTTGLFLAMSGYTPNTIQHQSTLSVIHGAFTLFTALVTALGIIPMFLNKFTDKKHAQIVLELSKRNSQKQKEETL